MRRMQAIFANASAEEGRDPVALAQSSRLTQPGKGSLLNSAFEQYLEDVLLAALDFPAEHARAHSIS